MDINQRKQELLRKYLENKCSGAELEELLWYLKSGNDDAYQEVVEDLWNKISIEKRLEERNADCLLEQVVRADKPAVFQYRRWYSLVAAVLALVIGIGTLFLLDNNQQQAPAIVKDTSHSNVIKPGSAKAILQAGSMQVILTKKDTSFSLAGNTVQVSSGNLKVADAKPVKYTLVVPRGGTYSLVLSDGTKVWLNADSKLIYPSLFQGKMREVTLIGEAYFKVNKEAKHPFVVHTKKQDIQVLGTAFNVHAYADEEKCITTLVAGKIKVSSAGKAKILMPGQQILSGNNGQLHIKKQVDIKQVIAWKNGYFLFKGTELHEVMRRLSRWYDVQIKYEKGVKNPEFMAIMNRSNKISQILDMLEATGAVRFKIEGKTVTVMSPLTSTSKK